MVVHLPIGIVLVYPWLELAGALTRKAEYGFAALGLLVAGLLGSMFASATGEEAYEHAESMGFSHDLLETHEEWAEMVPWVLVVLLAVRFWAGRKTRFGPWVGFGLGMLALGLIVQVGYTGGKLTYEHGVGVRGVEPGAAEAPE